MDELQVMADLGSRVAELLSSKLCFVSELFLNSQQLVVFGQSLRTTGGTCVWVCVCTHECVCVCVCACPPTSLNLPGTQSHHQISNECVLSLPTTMGHHHSPPIALGQLTRLNGLSDTSNLVHLHTNTIYKSHDTIQTSHDANTD